ncbi:MAG: hypothetical protein ABIX01_22615 [Chitinophagaceae bacterium]
MRTFLIVLFYVSLTPASYSQHSDSLKIPLADSVLISTDTILRIVNLNPYFTIHVDSAFNYDLQINKEPKGYFWFLKNSPVGLKINRDNGMLYFSAEKSYFKSGRLKYDTEYKVMLGVQNLSNPTERVDTSFTLLFYNTEILPSRVKPSVSSVLFADEGDSISFRLQCEDGTFPIENIRLASNMPIKNYSSPKHCDDDFSWTIPFDFIKDGDTARQKTLILQFISVDKFFNKDTAVVKIIVRDGINYPVRVQEHEKVMADADRYIAQLKYTFKQLDRQIKKTKNTRTIFDLTSATSALGGSVVTTINNGGTNTLGKILPSFGVALVPVKEAVSPQRIQEQNTTTQIRTVIKRLNYLQNDNSLINERDPDIIPKTKKLKEELKQAQMQLIDIPLMDNDGSESNQAIDKYFNDPKVNKKYKMTSKK